MPPAPAAATLTTAPGADQRFVTRASAFRGMLVALRNAGHYEAVAARVPPDVRKLMDDPPLAISWMPALPFQILIVHLAAVAGREAVRTVGEDSVLQGPMKSMQPVIESMLRLFGAEPAAFFKRLPSVMEGQLKGVEFEVRETGPRSVEITVTYSYLRHPPLESFVYWQGVFGITWRLCGCRGEATRPVILDTPEGNRARIDIAWMK